MTPRQNIQRELLEMLGQRISSYVPLEGHEHPAIWISQTFENLKSAVASGDTQAVSIACDFIERDPKLPFGKLVKSDLARALKKQVDRIVETERRQVLATTEKLLGQEYAPRELEDYCKLAKKFPREEVMHALSRVSPKNEKATQLCEYLRSV